MDYIYCVECYRKKTEHIKAEFIVNGKSLCQWHANLKTDYKEFKNKDSDNWFLSLFKNNNKDKKLRPRHLTEDEIKNKMEQEIYESRGTLPKGYGRSRLMDYQRDYSKGVDNKIIEQELKPDPTLPAGSLYKTGIAKRNNSVGADLVPSDLPSGYFRNKKLPFED